MWAGGRGKLCVEHDTELATLRWKEEERAVKRKGSLRNRPRLRGEQKRRQGEERTLEIADNT